MAQTTIRVWLDVVVSDEDKQVIMDEAQNMTNDEVTSLADATMRVVRAVARFQSDHLYEIKGGGTI